MSLFLVQNGLHLGFSEALVVLVEFVKVEVDVLELFVRVEANFEVV
jgi:hypothetical protein